MYRENPLIPTENELTIAQYAKLANKTNRFTSDKDRVLDNIILGFFGEVGSLLSAVKKKTRDDISKLPYKKAVVEELGDILWYFNIICVATGNNLQSIATQAANRSPAKKSTDLRFSDIETQFSRSRKAPIDRLIRLLISLAAEVGDFTNYYARNRGAHDKTIVCGHLVPIMKSLFRVACAANVHIQNAAVENLYKTYDRWPQKRRLYPELLDEGHPEKTEKFPRKLKIEIEQRRKRNRPYVFQMCNGINIGDPLTDNIRDEDYYRFHDVFHYAYAAKFGWSPVTRALFKLKRKSDPTTDEAEDGARAILIEEGLATMIFNHAKSLNLFEDVAPGELSFDLLKTIRDFVSGYEVQEMPFWLWEEAILEGFECFRFLKANRKGIVHIDLNKHSISISPLVR